MPPSSDLEKIQYELKKAADLCERHGYFRATALIKKLEARIWAESQTKKTSEDAELKEEEKSDGA